MKKIVRNEVCIRTHLQHFHQTDLSLSEFVSIKYSKAVAGFCFWTVESDKKNEEQNITLITWMIINEGQSHCSSSIKAAHNRFK